MPVARRDRERRDMRANAGRSEDRSGAGADQREPALRGGNVAAGDVEEPRGARDPVEIALRGNDAPTPPKLDDGEDDNIGGPGTPISVTFLGPLYQDAKLCAFVRGFEHATAFHAHPPQFTVGT